MVFGCFEPPILVVTTQFSFYTNIVLANHSKAEGTKTLILM